MTRDYALELLKTYVKNPKMIAHSLASEAIMRNLAKHFGEDEDKWGLAGLLHDIDVEITNGDHELHGLKAKEILGKEELDEDIIEAIALHNEMAAKMPRTTLFHHALAAGETISGFIFAVALIYPSKKISDVKVSSVTKRMKEKRFAASVNRDTIMECEMIGLSLNDFVQLCLEALSPIEDELGYI
jgi:putative nucleotidyltransferase with HDIG domain